MGMLAPVDGGFVVWISGPALRLLACTTFSSSESLSINPSAPAVDFLVPVPCGSRVLALCWSFSFWASVKSVEPTVWAFVLALICSTPPSSTSAGRHSDDRMPEGCFESMPASVYRSDLQAEGSRPCSARRACKTYSQRGGRRGGDAGSRHTGQRRRGGFQAGCSTHFADSLFVVHVVHVCADNVGRLLSAVFP